MNNEKNSSPHDGPEDDLQQRRRRLLKRSLLMVPAIVTLRAQPVMAATGTNTYGYGSYTFNDENGNGTRQPKEGIIPTGEVFYTQFEAWEASHPDVRDEVYPQFSTQ